MTASISRSDLELLSAYLDGELTPSERAALESRLAAEPDLRAALDGLRLTVRTLRATPVLAPPRSFVLDPARFRRRAPWWAQYGMYRLAGTLGAAASVALIALGVILSGMPGTPMAPAASLQEVAMDATSVTAAAPRLSALVTPTIAPMTEAAQMFAGDVADTPEAIVTVTALAPFTTTRTAVPTHQPEPAGAAAELGMDTAQESALAPPAALSAPGEAAPTAVKTLDIGSLRALPTPTLMASVTPSATPSPMPSPTLTASPTTSPTPTLTTPFPTAIALQAESTTAVVAVEPGTPSPGIASRILLVVGLVLLIISLGVLSLDILRKRL